MKFFIGLVALLLSTLLMAEIRYGYYDDGRPKHKRHYENGKLQGVSATFYPSGEVKLTAKFHHGVLWGTTFAYYENGRLKAEIPYKNGKISGMKKEYFENGQLYVAQNFEKDIPVGSKRVYYYNGNMKARLDFNDHGKLEGNAKEYYQGGMLKHAVNFRNGQALNGWMYDERGNRSRMTKSDFDTMGITLFTKE